MFEPVTELKHWVLIENEQFMSFLKQLEGKIVSEKKFTKCRLLGFFSEREGNRESEREREIRR